MARAFIVCAFAQFTGHCPCNFRRDFLRDQRRPLGRNQQRRSRLVDQDAVDLVDNGDIKPALDRLPCFTPGDRPLEPRQMGCSVGEARRSGFAKIVEGDLLLDT